MEAGLAGIGITEHNKWWPHNELVDLKCQFPKLTILDGSEISCPEGHFLVFLPESARRFTIEYEGLDQLCKRVF